ncbi:MAG: Coenzyme F420 hydrogenase/dehydrogenase, beta subunit C-terminal domain [bacterium]|nr:Coenzyme F420 hydrogenase/dehydrogenase, beta subunit C-terminal domain [bacterium]
MEIVERIREEARKALEEKKVELIIGFEEGSLPLRTTPAFIKSIDAVERLIWNATCENNLANYLLRLKIKGKVGIVAKGCDARSIINAIKERQIERDMVFIIGVPCTGMVDRKGIKERFDEAEILEAIEVNGQIKVKGERFEGSFNISDFLYDSCKTCTQKTPSLYDVIVGDEVKEREDVDEFREIREFEKKSPDERWAYFTREIESCIRCYACRNVCPLCYCKECFIDQSRPQWFGRSIDESDRMIFHIIRVFHTAGRCVDCGACERACPMGIDLRKLTKKVEKDVVELYNYKAGIDLETVPPLATYKEDDPQEFIK